MGTRSLTVMNDSWEKSDGSHTEIAVLYRQWDGYPEGHGRELAEFLSGMVITNGLRGGKTANGGDCLAAQIVAHFKTEPGNIYLYPAGTRDADEEYIYTVTPSHETGDIVLRVDSRYDGLVFEGTPEAFIESLDKAEALE